MKSLICLFALAMSLQATAKTIPVSVQCFVMGPRYDGILEVPDKFEGSCLSDRNTVPWQIRSTPSIFSLSFNDVQYVAKGMTVDFGENRCVLQTFIRAFTQFGEATEIHSHYRAGLKVEVDSYGIWSGEIASACTFASSQGENRP